MGEQLMIGERIRRGIGGFAMVADIVRHEHETGTARATPTSSSVIS